MMIQRVVTNFILTTQPSPSPKIAIFHRCGTMPTFPNHWAGISGSIEKGETPYQAAQRELVEETNITSHKVVQQQGGLYLDVPFQSKRPGSVPRIIRVYPFVVAVDDSTVSSIELRGTEHDRYKFVTMEELESMKSECVPGLVEAFHHATYGKYDVSITPEVKDWASDVQNGASVMTENAIRLVTQNPTLAYPISFLRPSMVPIVNVMRTFLRQQSPGDSLTEDTNDSSELSVASFQKDVQECVTMGIEALKELQQQHKHNRLNIATFSRSGTLTKILQPFRETCNIVCGRSTPGNEGELMAHDLQTEWVSDSELQQFLTSKTTTDPIDVLLIGADCILPDAVVNKVGTQVLCEAAAAGNIPVYCCADRWKRWDDIFPPPMEEDLFEVVPMHLVSKLLVPTTNTKNQYDSNVCT